MFNLGTGRMAQEINVFVEQTRDLSEFGLQDPCKSGRREMTSQ